MACACKAKKSGQITAIKQIVKNRNLPTATNKAKDNSSPVSKRFVKRVIKRSL